MSMHGQHISSRLSSQQHHLKLVPESDGEWTKRERARKVRGGVAGVPLAPGTGPRLTLIDPIPKGLRESESCQCLYDFLVFLKEESGDCQPVRTIDRLKSWTGREERVDETLKRQRSYGLVGDILLRLDRAWSERPLSEIVEAEDARWCCCPIVNTTTAVKTNLGIIELVDLSSFPLTKSHIQWLQVPIRCAWTLLDLLPVQHLY